MGANFGELQMEAESKRKAREERESEMRAVKGQQT